MTEQHETREAIFYKRHPIVATVVAGLIVTLITSAITFLVSFILPKEAEKTNTSLVESIATESIIPNSDIATESEPEDPAEAVVSPNVTIIMKICVYGLVGQVAWVILIFVIGFILDYFDPSPVDHDILSAVLGFIVVVILLLIFRGQIEQLCITCQLFFDGLQNVILKAIYDVNGL